MSTTTQMQMLEVFAYPLFMEPGCTLERKRWIVRTRRRYRAMFGREIA